MPAATEQLRDTGLVRTNPASRFHRRATPPSPLARTNQGEPVTTDVLANDMDPEGSLNPSTVEVQSEPRNGMASVDESTGALTYDPNDSQVGPDSLTYTVEDTGGNESGEAKVTIDVNGLPSARNDSDSINEADTTTIDVVSNDTDPEGQSLSVSSVSSPSNGQATNNNDGTITYSHDGSETSSDSFTYTVSDGNGGTDQATVSIDVNLRPNASIDSASVSQGGATTTDVLANDTDPDGSLDESTVEVQSDPDHGNTFVNDNGEITYTHDDSSTDGDTYTYTVKDEEGAKSNEATVTIDVQSSN